MPRRRLRHPLDRPTRIRVKDGTVFKIITQQMTYAPSGPLTSVLYGDGFTQTRGYDLSYRPTGLKDQKSATTRRNLTMGYEARDNLTTITDLQAAANNQTFTYTPRESLATASGPYGAMTFTYDGVGNRVTYKLGTATDAYTYPGTSNRLGGITLAAGGSRAFTYDAAGNVTLDNRTGGGYGYTYNSAGRLSEFRVNGVLQASYKYDALGRQAIRTLTSPTAVTIHSVFDSQGRRIAEYNESTGALIREYVWNGWEAIAVIEGGVISYVRTDHIGRPVFATNSTGTVVWTASYLPFGGVRTTTGVPVEARFPGQWFQSESGLYQNWMRDYDPTTGRYIEADPLGLVDGASVYGYVKQNPGRWVDSTGERTLYLGPGGWIIDKDWSYDPKMPVHVGNTFKHACSDAELIFHRATPIQSDHWHYYPYGQTKGGRRASEGRWYDRSGEDHLKPPYLIDIPDCPCDGSSADTSMVFGAALLFFLLFAPEAAPMVSVIP